MNASAVLTRQECYSYHLELNNMFKKPFSFEGRIRRTEYCLSLLIYLAAVGISMGISAATRGMGGVLLLPVIWFTLAQGVKRAHDLGNSGWYILIPFYGLWLMFAAGQTGSNEYGDDPKGFVDPAEVYAIGQEVQK